jgi:hypothetical protein
MPWVFAILILAPVLLVAFSRQTQGDRKRHWVIITLLFSWLGYIAFLIANARQRTTTHHHSN